MGLFDNLIKTGVKKLAGTALRSVSEPVAQEAPRIEVQPRQEKVGVSDPTAGIPEAQFQAPQPTLTSRQDITQAINQAAASGGLKGLLTQQAGLSDKGLSNQAIKEKSFQPVTAAFNVGLSGLASTRVPQALGATVKGGPKRPTQLLTDLVKNIRQTEDPGKLKDFLLGQASEDLGLTKGQPPRELAGAQFARGAEFEGGAAVAAEFAFDILADPLNLLDVGIAADVAKFSDLTTSALRQQGLLKEAEKALKAATKAFKGAPEAGPRGIMENFVQQIQGTPNGQRILQVLGEQSDEAKRIAGGAPTEIRFTEDMIAGAKTQQEKLRGMGKEEVPASGRSLGAASDVQRQIREASDARIPARTIRMSERQALVNRMRTIRDASIKTQNELQNIKKLAAKQIRDMIPANNISKTDINRLVKGVADATTEDGLKAVMKQAEDIAEATIQRQLVSDLRLLVSKSLSGTQRITPSQLQNADKLLGSRAFTVAEAEQQAISNLMEYFNLNPAGQRLARKFKSAEAFLKANPGFEGMPRKVIEGISGAKKVPINSLNNDDLIALKEAVQGLVERGKARTKLDIIRRTRSLDQQLDEISETATPWGAWDKQSMWNIVREADANFMTTQTIFDIVDGGIGSRSKWRRTGKTYDLIKRPVDEATFQLQQESGEFFNEASKFFDALKLTDQEFHNIAVHAYSRQPGARASLIKSGIPAEQIDRVPTEREMTAYNYMRSKLDEVKPQLDAVMQETKGKSIGYVKDYFPLMRNYDVKGIDDIVGAMEAAIDGRSFLKFKKDSAFGAIAKAREGGEQAVKLHAGEVFLKYMDKALYFKNMEPAIANARNIVAQDRFKDMAGEKGQEMISQWVGRLARAGRKETINPTIDPVLKSLKSHLSIAYLARLSTAFKQFSAGVLASGYIGPGRTLEGFGLLSSKKWRDFAWKNSKSLQLRAGGDATLFEVAKDLKTQGKTGKVRRALDRTNQVLVKNTIEKGDALTAMSVWLGAYKRGLALWGDDATEKAIQYADDIVDRSQVSGHFKDTSRAQNINELYNSMMPFQTFVLGQWNVIRDDIVKAGYKGDIYQKAESAGLAVALLSTLLAEEAVDYVKTNPEFKDDNLLEHWKNNLFLGAVSNVPLVGTIINQAAKDFEGGVFQPVALQETMRVANGFADIYNGKSGGGADVARGFASLAGLPVGMGRELYQLGSQAIPELGQMLPSLPQLGGREQQQQPVRQLGQPLPPIR